MTYENSEKHCELDKKRETDDELNKQKANYYGGTDSGHERGSVQPHNATRISQTCSSDAQISHTSLPTVSSTESAPSKSYSPTADDYDHDTIGFQDLWQKTPSLTEDSDEDDVLELSTLAAELSIGLENSITGLLCESNSQAPVLDCACKTPPCRLCYQDDLCLQASSSSPSAGTRTRLFHLPRTFAMLNLTPSR